MSLSLLPKAILTNSANYALWLYSFPGPQTHKQMLLEEAAYQQNIVLQASQALNLCVANDITFRGSTEEIEAERVLLLASKFSCTID